MVQSNHSTENMNTREHSMVLHIKWKGNSPFTINCRIGGNHNSSLEIIPDDLSNEKLNETIKTQVLIDRKSRVESIIKSDNELNETKVVANERFPFFDDDKKTITTSAPAKIPNSTMSTLTIAGLMAMGVSEDAAKAMIATMSKEQGKEEEKESKKIQLEEWKESSGYNKAHKKAFDAKQKWEKLEATLPEIPLELQTTKPKGAAIGGVKIASTWKGEGRSKHSAEKLAKQNIKDANWVCQSYKNIACPNGDGTDGTVETKFSNLLNHLISVNGQVDGKDLEEKVKAVKKSTYTSGCRYMCRTQARMDKHIAEECKHTK